ncbi:DUF3558 family protein [Amycolatopsis benzoatilytica]|uniref:DUF3558 family protein n=1 Tax=Amycolatopsis benzoatilytica TaxID=346045 RepID=UPI000A058EA4|nr:DUF3558 family protein [Amycolatopsis benzoatilytica]
MTTIKKSFGILTLLSAVAALGGCSKSVDGATESSTPTSPSAPSSSASSAEGSLTGLNQCDLLDQALAGQGFPPAKPTVADSKRTCGSQKLPPSGSSAPSVVVALSLQSGQRYTDNVNHPETARTGHIKKRASIEQPAPLGISGGCQINMAVGENSRVLVVVTSGSDTDGACKMAANVAAAVEPKLPA